MIYTHMSMYNQHLSLPLSLSLSPSPSPYPSWWPCTCQCDGPSFCQLVCCQDLCEQLALGQGAAEMTTRKRKRPEGDCAEPQTLTDLHGPVRKRRCTHAGAQVGQIAAHLGMVSPFSVALRWYAILRKYMLASRRVLCGPGPPRLALVADASHFKQDTLMGIVGSEVEGRFRTAVLPPQVLI